MQKLKVWIPELIADNLWGCFAWMLEGLASKTSERGGGLLGAWSPWQPWQYAHLQLFIKKHFSFTSHSVSPEHHRQAVLHLTQSAEGLISTVVKYAGKKMKENSLIARRQFCKCGKHYLTFLKYGFLNEILSLLPCSGRHTLLTALTIIKNITGSRQFPVSPSLPVRTFRLYKFSTYM